MAAVNLAKLVAKNLKKYGKPIGVKPCTLIKVVPGTRTPGAIAGGTNPTETPYAATGWIESYTADDIDNDLIRADDRRISILGASIALGQTPAPDDKVTIVDIDGVSKTFRITTPVTSDAVGAVFICNGRK